jgi:FlaA1/EpsC-like NDP-sugar epimerase
MTTPDYLKQVVISTHHRQRSGAAERPSVLARPSFTIMLWAALDFLSAIIAGFIAFRLRLDPIVYPTSHTVLRHLEQTAPLISIAYLIIFSFYLVLSAQIYGLYRSTDIRSGLNEQRLTVQATLTAGLLLCGTLYIMRAYAVSRIVVAVTITLTLLMVMIRRFVSRKLRQRRFLQGRETRNVLIVGDGRVAHALRNHLQAGHRQHRQLRRDSALPVRR